MAHARVGSEMNDDRKAVLCEQLVRRLAIGKMDFTNVKWRSRLRIATRALSGWDRNGR